MSHARKYVIIKDFVLSFSVAGTNHGTGFGLAHADEIHQRAVGWAGVGAAAAFDAVHDAKFFAVLVAFEFSVCVQHEGLETHRAARHALAAAQAGVHFPAFALFFVHEEQTAHALGNIGVEVGDGFAHHRTAGDDLAGVLRNANGVEYIADGGSQAQTENLALLSGQRFAGYCGVSLDDGLVFLHCLIQHIHGRDVVHNATHGDGQGAIGHAASGDGFNQLFFSTLRIFHLQGLNLDIREFLAHLNQSGDGSGLVGLDADDGFLSAGGDEGDLNADEALFGAFQNHAVVGGDVGLALGGVDDKVFAFLLWFEHVFDVGGEAGAAQSHDAAVFHAGNDFLFVEFDFADDVRRGVNALVPFVAFAVDDDGGFLVSGDVGNHVNAVHRA